MADKSPDARLNTELPSHPKTKKLIRRIGESGAWSMVKLFLWTAANRPSGNMRGMSSEDIELAIDWRGEPDAFVEAMVEVGFLEATENGYLIHDWRDHNPWASTANLRSLKAKWAAVKRFHGEAVADREVPEYAEYRQAQGNAQGTGNDAPSMENDAPSIKKYAQASGNGATSNAQASEPDDAQAMLGASKTMLGASKSDAPSPSPSPSPIPSPTPVELHTSSSTGEISERASTTSDDDEADTIPDPVPGEQDLPDWIPRGIWRQFYRHRQVCRKPLSIQSQREVVRRLDQLRQEGHDITLSLRQTMAAGLAIPVKPRNPDEHATSTRSGRGSLAGTPDEPGISLAEKSRRLCEQRSKQESQRDDPALPPA